VTRLDPAIHAAWRHLRVVSKFMSLYQWLNCIVQRSRPFVEASQALAIKERGSFILPPTHEELDARNRMLASFEPARSGDDLSLNAGTVHSAMTLPGYFG
jgi:hypothetical protein